MMRAHKVPGHISIREMGLDAQFTVESTKRKHEAAKMLA
jgi:hypothetical protein